MQNAVARWFYLLVMIFVGMMIWVGCVDISGGTSGMDSESGVGSDTTITSDTDTVVPTDPDTDSAVSTDPDTDSAVSTDSETDSAVSTDPDTDSAVSTDPDTDSAVSSDPDTDSDRSFSSCIGMAAKTLRDVGECLSPPLMIGAAVSSSQLGSIASGHFNFWTAENEMMWQSLQGSEGSFRFNPADAIVDAAVDRGVKVKGHCLVGHSQLASWVEQASGRDRVLDIMTTHIETVMEHFGNRVHSWDVVEEAILTDSSVGDGNARMRGSVFYNEIGEDYIDLAFQIARDFADSNGWTDMKLYYNDFSIDADNDKSRFAHEMIKGLVDRGVPIDGVGFQMHIGPPHNIPTAQSVADNMDYYIGLGLDVMISEMDINLCGGQVSVEQQAELYHDITAECVNRPQCTAITVWGVNDQNSWLNQLSAGLCNGQNSSSLLFSVNQQKDTYTQVLNALMGE